MVKRDKVIHGMLEDELRRCESMASSLREQVEAFPEGNERQRKEESLKSFCERIQYLLRLLSV
ncbi:hypothetical protein SAMN02745165_03285 [Malonomonas rubra DSM 5091]|uniref:Uncharacterized protein n=1 Tax=Malonomonas rubra DSM 5091 TaxID=1122189 RepID=A0A1M6MHP4_MALRU|nr:hypothetical protein SAMN02745165_03285 [Malonomonas rubra DSM 5091]